MIKKLGIGDLVKIRQPIYDDMKEETLNKSDFFILTSRYEGHPMGLLEALAYGVPVLASYGTNR